MENIMEEQKSKYVQRMFGIVLCLFFVCLLFWVVRYWEYMPYVDESATFSAVNNFISEGLPRVGVGKDSVMYDEPLDVQYYWTYFAEVLHHI